MSSTSSSSSTKMPSLRLVAMSVLPFILLQTIKTIGWQTNVPQMESTTILSPANMTRKLDAHMCEEDIDMNDFITPLNYNLTEVIHEITHGKGFYILRKGFSPKDIGLARARVDHLTKNNRVDTNTDVTQSAKHNSYGGKSGGIIWRLLGKGKIFEKIAQHPVTLEITRALLGPKSQISSYMSNTVQPGMGSQLPHLDYPYYEGYFPQNEHNIQRPLLSVSFMFLLSDFTVKNGGTAFRPGSQRSPSYPHDTEEFYRNMVQLEGEPGDIGIFGASTQHCAMGNNDVNPRVGIVKSMVPVYLKPYHDIQVPEDTLSKASPDMRTILAVDHPYPMKHG